MKNMRCAALLLSAFLLGGCSMTAPADVEELLRAPQFSGQYNQVQKALNTYLGVNAQLKYPTGGDSQSPFLFGDWDGNGVNDAAVLFQSSTLGQNVDLAILEQNSEGWFVTQVAEGLSGEVSSVSTATLNDAHTTSTQLLVGYATSQGDEYLGVYSYSNRTLSTVLETPFSEYLLCDLTENGAQDLVIVQSGSDGLQLQLLSVNEGNYRLAQTLSVSQGRFTGCAGLYEGTARGDHFLYIDGYTGTGDSLATEVLIYDSDKGLQPYDSDVQPDIYSASLRNFTALKCRDIDSNGVMDIPLQMSGEQAGGISSELDRRICYVLWQDVTAYTQLTGRRSFGIADAEYGFYLKLPLQWRGRVQVKQDAAGEGWQVYDSSEEENLLLQVRVADLDVNRGVYARAGLLGQQQILIHITEIGQEEGFDSVTGSVALLG